MKLSELSAPKGARKRRKLLGRGESSGHGKTCCRGGKGQTARSGGTIRAGFEGGQMPLVRRIPKLGFVSRQGARGLNRYAVIDLSILEAFDSGAAVDAEALAKRGYAANGKQKAGIKIVGSKSGLTKKLSLKVNAITKSAREAVEKAGGSVEILA